MRAISKTFGILKIKIVDRNNFIIYHKNSTCYCGTISSVLSNSKILIDEKTLIEIEKWLDRFI